MKDLPLSSTGSKIGVSFIVRVVLDLARNIRGVTEVDVMDILSNSNTARTIILSIVPVFREYLEKSAGTPSMNGGGVSCDGLTQKVFLQKNYECVLHFMEATVEKNQKLELKFCFLLHQVTLRLVVALATYWRPVIHVDGVRFQ